MEKTKKYKRGLFAAKVIRAASATLQREADPRQQHDRRQYLKVPPPPTDVPLPTLEVGSRPQRPAIDEVVQVEGVPGEVEVRLSASYSMKLVIIYYHELIRAPKPSFGQGLSIIWKSIRLGV